MAEVMRSSSSVVQVRRQAANGHHLTVADVLAFAETCRAEGIPESEHVGIDHSHETMHLTAISARWVVKAEEPDRG